MSRLWRRLVAITHQGAPGATPAGNHATGSGTAGAPPVDGERPASAAAHTHDQIKANLAVLTIEIGEKLAPYIERGDHGTVLSFGQGGEDPIAFLKSASGDGEGIEIRHFDIIYDLIETVEAAISGLLAPVEVELIDGHAEVLQIFPIRGVGNIAGSRCDDGSITREASAKVLRNGSEIARGKLSSLRRFQDDVQDVQAGQEFGVGIEGFEAFEPGDQLEFFHIEMQSRIVRGGRVETVTT